MEGREMEGESGKRVRLSKGYTHLSVQEAINYINHANWAKWNYSQGLLCTYNRVTLHRMVLQTCWGK